MYLYLKPQFKIEDAIGKAYELSKPQGLGHLHFTPGPLSESEMKFLTHKGDQKSRIPMDYVLGRAVKLTIYIDRDGAPFIENKPWYDHSDEQWNEFKSMFSASKIVHLAKDEPEDGPEVAAGVAGDDDEDGVRLSTFHEPE